MSKKPELPADPRFKGATPERLVRALRKPKAKRAPGAVSGIRGERRKRQRNQGGVRQMPTNAYNPLMYFQPFGDPARLRGLEGFV